MVLHPALVYEAGVHPWAVEEGPLQLRQTHLQHEASSVQKCAVDLPPPPITTTAPSPMASPSVLAATASQLKYSLAVARPQTAAGNWLEDQLARTVLSQG